MIIITEINLRKPPLKLQFSEALFKNKVGYYENIRTVARKFFQVCVTAISLT